MDNGNGDICVSTFSYCVQCKLSSFVDWHLSMHCKKWLIISIIY